MVCNVTEEIPDNLWYLDTGCSNHMCGDKTIFSDLDESFFSTVKFGDNSKINVVGRGNIIFKAKGNKSHKISDVFFVPELKTNLISLGQFQEKGYEILIKNGVCRFKMKN